MKTTTKTPAGTVISVRASKQTSKRLDALAAATNRSKSYLANQAVERYLAEEEEYIAAVNEGIADADAGRLHSLDKVDAALRKTIREAAKQKK